MTASAKVLFAAAKQSRRMMRGQALRYRYAMILVEPEMAVDYLRRAIDLRRMAERFERQAGLQEARS